MEAGGRLPLAEALFINGLDAKVWMCEQLNLIRFQDRHLRAGGGYCYTGIAESGYDMWQTRLVDARARIVWDSTVVGSRRG